MMTGDDASGQAATPVREGAGDSGFLATVLEDLPVGVVITDARGGVHLWNRAAQELLGLTEPQMRGQEAPDPARAVVHEDGSEFSLETQPLAVALATGRPVRDIVMGIYHPARRQRSWLLVNAALQFDQAGILIRLVATYSDITERRGFEARVTVADRLAAMGTLAAGIAHEINNPLAYILANLTYADEELSDEAALSNASRLAEIRHALLEARDGAERVRNIVTEMRGLARTDSPRRPVNVTAVLESATRAVASELRLRAKLVKQLQEVPLVSADEARLGQVFLNLLMNAADAIPEGHPSQHEVAVSTAADGAGNILVEIRDTGVGIAPELHQRIFDPFFTSKPVARGMGLGLAMCHHIITDFGGTISVQSSPAGGSTFRVLLPAAVNGGEGNQGF